MKTIVFAILALTALTAETTKKPEEAEVTHTIKFTIRIGDEDQETPITIGLFGKDAPKTVDNFYTICTKGVENQGKTISFNDSIFHRIIPNFMIQGGDITNFNGTGGVSIYGARFEDEPFVVKHDVGVLSMANAGPNTNGSQFFITTAATPWLDGRHVVFGRVLGDMQTVYAVEKQGTGSGKPNKKVTVVSCESSSTTEV